MHYKKLFILLLFISCQGSANNKYETLLSKVEERGISNFKPITYHIEGNNEIYTYSFNDSSRYVWTYRLHAKKFDLPEQGFETFKKAVTDPLDYIQKTKNIIQTLHINKIDQSPWIGNIIRFWMSDFERITYIDPAFKFDHTYKTDWVKEINKGQRIKENWYFVRADQ